MADIRYVIVSDLHFGAENSVLTTLDERPATARDRLLRRSAAVEPGAVRLVDGLRELTRGQAAADPYPRRRRP